MLYYFGMKFQQQISHLSKDADAMSQLKAFSL